MTMGGGGAIDPDAILDAVAVFERRLDECIHRVRFRNSRHAQYDDVPISVREARVTLVPGIHQDGAFVDVQWWQNGDYKYHYREAELQFRFDREQDTESTAVPVAHFHPPDTPDQHRASCIPSEHPVELVTLAVIANWLSAARQNDPSVVNALSDPP